MGTCNKDMSPVTKSQCVVGTNPRDMLHRLVPILVLITLSSCNTDFAGIFSQATCCLEFNSVNFVGHIAGTSFFRDVSCGMSPGVREL